MEVYIPLNMYFSDDLPLNFEGTHCYSDEFGYHHCEIERGQKALNNKTYSLFEITYWIVRLPMADMASAFEKKNKKANQDFRRIMFGKELELFQELGGNHKKRAEIDKEEILKEYPFED